MRRLSSIAAILVFATYTFVGLFVLPAYNHGRDISIFAKWSLFSDMRPRDMWLDLRATRGSETVFFSRDYAAKKVSPVNPLRMWSLLQDLRFSDTPLEKDDELYILLSEFKLKCECEDIHLVAWKGSLNKHLQGDPGLLYSDKGGFK